MRSIVFLLTAGLMVSAASAAPPPAASSATPVAAPAITIAPPAAETFVVGSLHVSRYGDHGRPLILIPGLASGAWVWKDTIAHLRQDHVIYAVTLAGFNGIAPPAQATGLMDLADASLLELIESRDIQHPVLIGHSLGGTLAIGFATRHSDLLAGVVAVDGLPVFPGFENMTPAQRSAAATRMQQAIAQATPAQFRAQQTGYMRVMGVLDAADAQKYGALQARSDATAVGQYMAEDLQTDLRPGLPRISVPLLEISPYNAPDFRAAAARSNQPVTSEAAKADHYRQLLSGDPQAKVVSISPARHFVMLDQPQQFLATLDTFLTGLEGTP